MPLSLGKWPSIIIVCMPLAVTFGKYIYRKMTDKPGLDAIQPIAELEAPDNNPEVSGQVATGVLEEPISPLSAAEKFKKDGNRCFYNYRYVDAIRCYSKAIDMCPKEHTTELAIYYHNRAACHEMIENWIQVKEDCAKALEYNRRYIGR